MSTHATVGIITPFHEPEKPANQLSAHINNMQDYADSYPYIVVRNCDIDGIWFYGAYHDFEKAIHAASECGNGIVIAKEYVERNDDE